MKRFLVLAFAAFASCSLFEVRRFDVPELASVKECRAYVGRIKYATDDEQYGCADYWATPEETIASGRGDCEDKARLFLALVRENFGESGALGIYKIVDAETGKASCHATGITSEYEFGYLGGEKILEYSFSACFRKNGEQ
jgi:hypothetical protein